MKHVKKYKMFESQTGIYLSETQIDLEFLDYNTEGSWEYDRKTRLVDVRGNFNCSYEGIEDFRGIRFGFVQGNFDCSHNKLTSIEGAPHWTSLFDCSHNKINSLKGSPKEVECIFDCSHNKLTSLEGAPKKIWSDFICSHNNLTSLKGAPEEADFFDCRHNPLTSLEGAPRKVEGAFECDEFVTLRGEWTPEGWVKVLKEGSLAAKNLILTLPYFSPSYIQKEIDKNPGKMAISLKGVWKLPEFKKIKDQLVIPKGFEDDFETQSDLSDLGF